MEPIVVRDSSGIKGLVTLRRHPAGTIEKLEKLHANGEHDAANRLLAAGEIVSREHNIVVDSANRGIDLLIQWLISGLNSVNPYPIGPQWGEIGTGTATPALSDTALQTPVMRAALSYAADLSFNKAQLQFFFPDGLLANGTYTEFGTYVSTSSSIGAGQLFNHALFSPVYSKSSGNDTTCEVDLTIANT